MAGVGAAGVVGVVAGDMVEVGATGAGITEVVALLAVVMPDAVMPDAAPLAVDTAAARFAVEVDFAAAAGSMAVVGFMVEAGSMAVAVADTGKHSS